MKAVGERFCDRPAEALVSVVARRPYFANENNAKVVCSGALVREASVGGRLCRNGT